MDRTFNYPAKNAERDSWMQGFLPRTLLNESTVLFLPAPEWLERTGYLEKGIRPHHLIGAEHDQTVLVEVEANRGEARLIAGSIRHAVETTMAERLPPFCVASLDFDGSYNTYVRNFDLLSVFRAFPARPEGYLRITSYSARGRSSLERGVENISKFYSGLGFSMTRFMQELAGMVDVHRRLKRMQDSRVPDHAHMARELGLMWWLTLGMGLMDYDRFGYGKMDQKYMAELGPILDHVAEQARNIQEGTELSIMSIPELAGVLGRRKSSLWPTEMWRTAYMSINNQPMRTWYFRISHVENMSQAPTLRDVLEQLWNLTKTENLVFIDEHGSSITIGEDPRRRK